MADIPMEADLNQYDSFHAVTDHPLMRRQELEKLYVRCWKEFYRAGHMIEALKRCSKKHFWWLFKMFLWYRNSIFGEKTHPMMCGFVRIKSLVFGRRPGSPKINIAAYAAQEIWRFMKYIGHLFREFYVFQHVYFQSQLKRELALRLSSDVRGARDWFSRTFRLPATRAWLNQFWLRYGRQKWNLFWKLHWHGKMIPFALTEIIYTFRFVWVMLKNAHALIYE